MSLKVLFVVASIVILSISIIGSIAPQEKVPVIIGFKDKKDPDLIKENGGEIKREYTLINAIAAKLPKNKIEELKKNPKVAYVESDRIVQALAETTPWGVTKINAPAVWQNTSTNKGTGIKVAILDTGIQSNHPDLINNIKGGVNFAGRPDGSTNPRYWTDKNGHGTHVAGIVAAVGDNDIGVIGVAPEAHLYAVKVLNNAGSGYTSDIIQGLQWAADNAQIASMSFGSSYYNQAEKDAIDAARAKGLILIAAAGNSGDGNPSTNNVGYPARYNNVIAVAATNSNDVVASWSSDGLEVDVSAPGVDILSTYKGSSYAYLSGTSMATPYVTGTVALMLKAGISANDIQSKLQATAVDINAPGFDVFSGYGRINAFSAIQ
ncbi:S8 family peptidase [Candidatus Methanoperedens nitratireducens]|uniref:Subtilisin Carlsberg n=1 Tax=Candidatus Methanoperedens nitratireducens TaxID=1392998 RepID=A0A284VN38_9EURY|nr:S8 family peptidase [Candidatus Methanoperedens nitroreducens]SNQ60607.1 Subtilisin Carlsberg [Candidatus Methanoperedens nitroreducens]